MWLKSGFGAGVELVDGDRMAAQRLERHLTDESQAGGRLDHADIVACTMPAAAAARQPCKRRCCR